MLKKHTHTGFLDEIVEDGFGHVRLKVPFDWPAVFRADPLEKLERVAADDLFLSVIGPAEASGDHPTEMTSGFKEGNRQSFTARGDGGHHATGCAAVHHQIECLRGTGGLFRVHNGERENNCQTGARQSRGRSPAAWRHWLEAGPLRCAVAGAVHADFVDCDATSFMALSTFCWS